jgi:hypothetical protein
MKTFTFYFLTIMLICQVLQVNAQMNYWVLPPK